MSSAVVVRTNRLIHSSTLSSTPNKEPDGLDEADEADGSAWISEESIASRSKGE
ncbi:hypothetical protein ACFFX0_24085 [Citricoccus parietis]|uniref:Uncharacterized protein n=1 Tax=Citricoccus parietis TaxID=592307 RepID=A0ABV5G575_9MICC